jgi:hypothetical protein
MPQDPANIMETHMKIRENDQTLVPAKGDLGTFKLKN